MLNDLIMMMLTLIAYASFADLVEALRTNRKAKLVYKHDDSAINDVILYLLEDIWRLENSPSDNIRIFYKYRKNHFFLDHTVVIFDQTANVIYGPTIYLKRIKLILESHNCFVSFQNNYYLSRDFRDN